MPTGRLRLRSSRDGWQRRGTLPSTARPAGPTPHQRAAPGWQGRRPGRRDHHVLQTVCVRSQSPAERRNNAASRKGTPKTGASGDCSSIRRSSTSVKSEKIQRSASGVGTPRSEHAALEVGHQTLVRLGNEEGDRLGAVGVEPVPPGGGVSRPSVGVRCKEPVQHA